MSTQGGTPTGTDTELDRERRQARATRVIAAPPSEIFDVLADPAMHPVIDGSDTVVDAGRSNPDRLEPGARFGMSMRWKVFPYPIRNVVVEYEQDRLIAWRHFAGHRWRWELEPVDAGPGGRPGRKTGGRPGRKTGGRSGQETGGRPGRTRVVHTFDWSTSRWPWALELVGYPSTNLRGMQGTIERLDELVTG